MKKIVCEVCNSQNIKKENGIFICKECGTEYSLDEVKNLMQEVEDDGASSIEVNYNSELDRLITAGKQITSTIPIDDSQIGILKNIKDKILLEDYNNKYGKLFECLIEIHKKNLNHKHIQTIIDFNDEEINKIVFNSIMYYFNQSLFNLFYAANEKCDDMLYYRIELIGTDYMGYFSSLQSYYDKLPEDVKTQYDELYAKIQTAAETIIGYVYESVSRYMFTKESVDSFEFTNKFSNLISNSYLFVHAIKNYITSEKIDETCKNIYQVIKRNAHIIMSNNIYGPSVIKYAALLSGMTEEEAAKSINAIAKTLTGCWCAGNPIVFKFYGDKVIVTGIGPDRTIPAKDVLLVNCKVAVYTKDYSTATTFWWDLVYKLSDTSYTVLHFGYDLKVAETVHDCVQWNEIYGWTSRADIKFEQTQYESGNPFINGMGQLRYIDTISEYQPQSSGKSGCYVATCVYGSYDCSEVWRLRRYRDNYLDSHWWGKLFIKCYYAVSPTLVKWFGKKDWFKKPIKKFLDKKLTKLEQDGYEDTPYKDKY